MLQLIFYYLCIHLSNLFSDVHIIKFYQHFYAIFAYLHLCRMIQKNTIQPWDVDTVRSVVTYTYTELSYTQTKNKLDGDEREKTERERERERERETSVYREGKGILETINSLFQIVTWHSLLQLIYIIYKCASSECYRLCILFLTHKSPKQSSYPPLCVQLTCPPTSPVKKSRESNSKKRTANSKL